MKNQKLKTLVLSKHIDKGIERYKGLLANDLQIHLENIAWSFIPYRFEDGRIMLVYADKSFALLYTSEEALYQDMDTNI